jgi:hypothetical protein
MYIYLNDLVSQRAFTPVTNTTQLIAQFLPTLGPGDSDFSVGVFAQGSLLSTGSQYYYQLQFYSGGLVGGNDYLLQISEYNTVTTSFYMATTPNRDKVRFMYNYYPSDNNYQYFDISYVQFYRFFRQVQFLHTTTTVSHYNTITINYNPYGSLPIYSSSN